MQQAYFLDLLKTLSPQETEKFTKFVNSGVWTEENLSKDAVSLLGYILEYIEFPDHQALKKESAYSYLFPNKPFVNGKIDKLLSELSKELRKFLLIDHYLDNDKEFNSTFSIAKILRQRNITSRYPQFFDKAKSILERRGSVSKEMYYDLYLYEYDQHQWLSMHNKQRGNLNFRNTIFALDQFYYISKIDILNNLLIHKKVTQVEEEDLHLVTIFNEVEAYNSLSSVSPLLEINYRIFHLFKTESFTIENFNNLLLLLKDNLHMIEPSTIRYYYTLLRNVCSVMIDKGFVELYPILFSIQKENLNLGYLLVDGKLLVSTYTSIATIAMKCTEFDWTHTFLEDFREKLIGETPQNDYYKLNLASYYCATRQFELALENLPEPLEETHFNNIARRLEIKCYYELKSDLLTYKLDAFRMFITRVSKNLLPPEYKEYQANFVNLLTQIIQSPTNDKKRALKLVERIQEKQKVSDREWLIEKACELGKIDPQTVPLHPPMSQKQKGPVS